MVDELNIFKTTEQILRLLTEESVVDNMPKKWRVSLYSKMVDNILDMHTLVYYANTLVDKRVEYLRQYLGELERLKSLTRVAHECRIFTHGQNARLFELYESAGKQAAAWKKKAQQRLITPPQTPPEV